MARGEGLGSPMAKSEKSREPEEDATLLPSRLALHLRCLREDATNPGLSSLERLALVRVRAVRIREIRQALEALRRPFGPWGRHIHPEGESVPRIIEE